MPRSGQLVKREMFLKVTPLDDIILATGYLIKFPFLPKEVVSVEDNQVQLYKYVFPPHLKHPSLAIIGLVQPVGSLFPVAEMQCQQLSRPLATITALPDLSSSIGYFGDSPTQNVTAWINDIRRRQQLAVRDDATTRLIGAKLAFTEWQERVTSIRHGLEKNLQEYAYVKPWQIHNYLVMLAGAQKIDYLQQGLSEAEVIADIATNRPSTMRDFISTCTSLDKCFPGLV
ncbi:hypothetical protein HPB51_019676 [Rhipicephalus microplus]|uniref:Flavin-containing monooxygenase n=1 Tax=Rhipicephalus microplus TaxID=6941 RepID=A0A9J6EBD8_RHIMP|nr:hypothetical protein HPB51_019676 [Rhipicephalus microplus]